MGVTVADLVAKLRLDFSQFASGARQSGAATDKLKADLSGVDKTTQATQVSFGKIIGTIGAVAAALTAAGFIVRRFTDALMQSAAEARNLSAVSGLSVEAADNLNDTFELLGFNSQVLTTALFRLGQRIDEGGDALHRIRAAAGDLGGELRTEGDLFLALRDRISHMGTASERSAALMQLFGRSGRELASAFALSSEQFREYMRRASDLSPMNDEINRKAMELTIATNALAKSWEGFKIEIGLILAGPATGLLNFLTEVLQKVKDANRELADLLGGAPQFPTRGGIPTAERLREPGGGAPFRGGGGGPAGPRSVFTREELLAMSERTTQLQAELELTLLLNKEQAEVNSLVDAYEELKDVTERVAKARETIEDALLDEALQKEELEVLAVARAWEQAVVDTADAARRQREEMRQTFVDVFDAIQRGISGMVTGVLQGTQTMEDAFRRMGQNIAISLVEMIVNRALRQIQEAIVDTIMLSQSASGGGGLISVILGALGGLVGAGPVRGDTGGVSLSDTVRSGQGGGMVTGTDPVLTILHPPEIVMPLDKLPDFAGAGRASVQQVFNVHPGVPEAVRRELWALMPEFQRAAKVAVMEEANRGGPMARAMRRRGA